MVFGAAFHLRRRGYGASNSVAICLRTKGENFSRSKIKRILAFVCDNRCRVPKSNNSADGRTAALTDLLHTQILLTQSVTIVAHMSHTASKFGLPSIFAMERLAGVFLRPSCLGHHGFKLPVLERYPAGSEATVKT